MSAFEYQTRKLAAIEALASGRIDDAAAIVHEMQAGPRLIQRGVCRYCSCSEARACAILVGENEFGAFAEPRVARCSWADDDGTVCTNVSCLERWRRESPAELDVDVHDVTEAAARQSRIVLP